MLKKANIFFGTLFMVVQLHAQYGFQKVYDHTEIDTFSILSDIYLDGDSIYVTLGSGKSPNRDVFTFGKVNELGDLELILNYNVPNHLQKVGFSNVDLDTNYAGNLVNVYRDIGSYGNCFRLIEYDLNGTLFLDTVYTSFEIEDSTQFFDYSKVLHTTDSAYLVSLNFVDRRENGSSSNLRGTMLLKIDHAGEILWEKRYHSDPLPSWKGLNLIEKAANRYMLHISESRRYGPSLAELNWGRIHFLTLDETGELIDQKTFQDGQYCISFFGSYFDQDTVYLQYFDSKLFGEPGNSDHFKLKPVLAKIGPDMEIIWKKELYNSWGQAASFYGSIQRIRKVNDTSFVGAHKYTNLISGAPTEPPIIYSQKVRFYNFTSTGNYNWVRDYHYYPLDSVSDPSYEINDIELMSDGGYILGGQVINGRLTSQNKPGQFAYLLRTNCLGFINPPQAALSYESHYNEVFFTNNSLNAGSYVYYFGDGDSLHTGEDINSITHIYEHEGDYEVTLIAKGCNGAADTVTLELNVGLEEESTGAVGDGVFIIYPNPVTQGGLLTIETGNIENTSLYFYDMNGKFLKQIPLPNAKSVYFMEQNFASGMYVGKLMKNGVVLSVKKMVVN